MSKKHTPVLEALPELLGPSKTHLLLIYSSMVSAGLPGRSASPVIALATSPAARAGW
jgi:hypothetical protein